MTLASMLHCVSAPSSGMLRWSLSSAVTGLPRSPQSPSMSLSRDPWAVLGVQQGASKTEVRAAYRKCVLRYHPDRNIHDPSGAERVFKDVGVAFDDIMSGNADSQSSARSSSPTNAATEFERAAAQYASTPTTTSSVFGCIRKPGAHVKSQGLTRSTWHPSQRPPMNARPASYNPAGYYKPPGWAYDAPRSSAVFGCVSSTERARPPSVFDKYIKKAPAPPPLPEGRRQRMFRWASRVTRRLPFGPRAHLPT